MEHLEIIKTYLKFVGGIQNIPVDKHTDVEIANNFFAEHKYIFDEMVSWQVGDYYKSIEEYKEDVKSYGKTLEEHFQENILCNIDQYSWSELVD